MTMTRMFRRFVCRLMLGVLVFGQLAIAAYACPALSGMPQSLPTMALNASAAAMPGDEAGAAMAVSPDMVATSDMAAMRSEEHTSELQSQSNLVCRLLLEK